MKKTLAKILALALCAVLLVTGTVFVTLAYLQSQTGVIKNTFTSANIKIFLDEAIVNDMGQPLDAVDGNVVDLANAARTDNTRTGNEYRLIPGNEYVKDPTITVDANSEECFLVIAIHDTVFKDAVALETSYKYVDENNTGKGTIYDQLEKNGWHEFEGKTLHDSYFNAGGVLADWSKDHYTLYYYCADKELKDVKQAIVDPNGTAVKKQIFEGFAIDGDATFEVTDEDSLEIIAFAFQTTGLGDIDEMSVPEAIWNNFSNTFNVQLNADEGGSEGGVEGT